MIRLEVLERLLAALPTDKKIDVFNDFIISQKDVFASPCDIIFSNDYDFLNAYLPKDREAIIELLEANEEWNAADKYVCLSRRDRWFSFNEEKLDCKIVQTFSTNRYTDAQYKKFSETVLDFLEEEILTIKKAQSV
jgi:hypothetical protein